MEILGKIPHTGYSEGLDWHQGYLWHALPKDIVKIDPKDGSVVARYAPASEYSESVAWFKGTFYNVSYSDNGLYFGTVYPDRIAFQRKADVPEAHAWGITNDGKDLIVTGNYSSTLYFLDAKTGAVKRKIKTKIPDLEDLAWDGVGIWTSSFTAYKGMIFRIDPQTGENGDFYELPNAKECPIIDGIAYDGKDLWVTGKNCLSIYKVRRPKDAAGVAKK